MRHTGSLALAGVLLASGIAPGRSLASTESGHRAGMSPSDRSPARAPGGPPLAPANSGAAQPATKDGVGASPAEPDPLAVNGLGSPSCRPGLDTELPMTSRRDCETSGFAAAPAPTGNYGLDVHIDTGLAGFGSGWLLSAVQDLLVAPLWMALVWAVRALVVMLEWCFSFDLLGAAGTNGLPLLDAQREITGLWLPLALAVAAVLAAYNGLVRRRIATTVGEACLMLAMMAGGIGVAADPAGTVGVLGTWANQASLGTLAIASHGTPARPGAALAGSLSSVFQRAIEDPWCYLEFGDVEWCRDPSRLDPRLHSAGMKLAEGQLSSDPCARRPARCAHPGGSSDPLARSAELLRDARTNGEFFLALPANGPARNSINQQSSLLRAICRSSDATGCRGPDAAEATFRTGSGTWSRMGGLVLITGGLLGMMLLLGFIAVRLLTAAIASLVYLLLTPAIVLAPAFGERGRRAFIGWGSRLLAAVVSKLVFAFLLGVVLAVMAVLTRLGELGWWTQWLLMSSFWWTAYLRRHRPLGGFESQMTYRRGANRSVPRRVSDVLQAHDRVRRVLRERAEEPSPQISGRRWPEQRYQRFPAEAKDEQAERLLELERRRSRVEDPIRRQERLTAMRDQLRRVEGAEATAEAGGDSTRASKLRARRDRIAEEIAQREQTATAGRELPGRVSGTITARARWSRRELIEERTRLLDEQATLPSSRVRAGRLPRRAYLALAGLAGLSRETYAGLSPRAQREARLEIDRELALRAERRLLRPATEESSPALGSQVGSGGTGALVLPDPSSESPIFADMKLVAEGRKKYLGFDQP